MLYQERDSSAHLSQAQSSLVQWGLDGKLRTILDTIMYSNISRLACALVRKTRSLIHSIFSVLKKLSAGELSQQSPLRLIEQTR